MECCVHQRVDLAALEARCQLSGIGVDIDDPADIAIVDLPVEARDHVRSKANEAFVANELARSRALFDRIEARPLTDEQRKAVVVDERRNLVVAAAGSGKTSVIVAKAGWLIRRKYRKPSELLLLAFARDARNEMEERVRKRLCPAIASGVAVRTFHSLGMSIIGEAEGRRPSLARTAESDRALFDALKSIVADLLADRALSDTVLEWFQDRFAPYHSAHEFPNWGAYWNYIRRNEIRSLKGDEVRSYEECEIANFLYLNGVAYEYEAPYEHETATAAKRQYKPDFFLPEHGIYIEHFRLDAAGNTAPFVDRRKCHEEMEWKRQVHAERGTVLIETFTRERADGRLIRNLEEKLAARGVELTPLPREQVFSALEDQGRIDPFIRLVATFLQHFKGSRLSLEEVARRARSLDDEGRAKAFTTVFRPIFERYRETLARAGEIDFHDMISRAADHVEAGRYRSPFGYILVDEFQDISPGRARLLKALLDGRSSAQLFAVGDDWQAIYRFGGSDIAIMREFGDRFGDFERIDLETTFRCADRISAVATDFVLRNPAQIPKTVRATRKADGPAVHVGLAGGEGLSLLKEALDRVADDARRHDGMSEVLLLGRYRHLRPPNLGSLPRQYPGLRFTYKTVHRAKGLEADYAVVLGLCAGRLGFPVEIADDPLLDLVMAAPETHPNAEERRLLYVALTRARRQAFPLAGRGASVRVRHGTDRRRIRCPGIRAPARRRRAVSAVPGGAPGAPGKRPRQERLLRLLELALLRTHDPPVSEVRNGPAGQVGRRVPLSGLRGIDRRVSGLRRLARNEDGAVRPFPRMLELPGMRLHPQFAKVRKQAEEPVRCAEDRTAQATLTLPAHATSPHGGLSEAAKHKASRLVPDRETGGSSNRPQEGKTLKSRKLFRAGHSGDTVSSNSVNDRRRESASKPRCAGMPAVRALRHFG